MTPIGQYDLRRRLVALACWVLVTACGWLGCRLLADLPFATMKYVVLGLTSTCWSVLCLFIGAVATVIAAGLLLALALRAIRPLWIRITVGTLGVAAVGTGALFLVVLCYIGLLAVGIEGTQTVVAADDGTTIMITQDGFDGDMVNLYDPGPGWSAWTRRHEIGRVDPRDGTCTLKGLDASRLLLTCGARSQELARH